MRPPGFHVLLVHPVVADVRVGHRHDLPFVGWIGQDLLIPGHRHVETNLAAGRGGRAEARPVKDRAVFEGKRRFHESRNLRRMLGAADKRSSSFAELGLVGMPRCGVSAPFRRGTEDRCARPRPTKPAKRQKFPTKACDMRWRLQEGMSLAMSSLLLPFNCRSHSDALDARPRPWTRSAPASETPASSPARAWPFRPTPPAGADHLDAVVSRWL